MSLSLKAWLSGHGRRSDDLDGRSAFVVLAALGLRETPGFGYDAATENVLVRRLAFSVAERELTVRHAEFCPSNSLYKVGTMNNGAEKIRCAWAGKSPLELAYHDTEWGVPVHDDRLLFEFLVLEAAQAGLSWTTILRKREGYRQAFCGFEPHIVASFDEAKVQELLGFQEIVRNRMKIEAAIRNARAFQGIRQEYGTFDAYIWRFVNGSPVRNAWHDLSEVPSSTVESLAMSKDLKKRGFSFVGPTICYAFMQAVGMVNDHTIECFRWREIDEAGAARS